MSCHQFVPHARYDVSNRGRIPADVMGAYAAAN
ncbi:MULTISPECIES: Lsr2 family DNA-binding protein [Dietzia]